MKTVLVTCSGGAGAYSIRKALKNKYRIIGVDSNCLSEGLYRKENDKSYIVKKGIEEGYIEEILEICKTEKINVIWPTSDEEIIAISKSQEIFEKNGIKIVSSSYKTIKRVIDKLINCKNVKALGIPTPDSFELTDFMAKKHKIFPVIVRPKFGRGAIGVNFCNSEREIIDLSKNISNKSNYFVQEVIENSAGDMHMACAMFDINSELVAYFASRSILTQHSWGGCALGGVPVKNSKLEETAIKILQRTGPWIGPVNIEFLWNKRKERFEFIEINPRYWGYSSLVVAAGIDFPTMAVKIALGEEVEKQFDYRTDVVTLPSREQIAYRIDEIKGSIPGWSTQDKKRC